MCSSIIVQAIICSTFVHTHKNQPPSYTHLKHTPNLDTRGEEYVEVAGNTTNEYYTNTCNAENIYSISHSHLGVHKTEESYTCTHNVVRTSIKNCEANSTEKNPRNTTILSICQVSLMYLAQQQQQQTWMDRWIQIRAGPLRVVMVVIVSKKCYCDDVTT